MARAKTICCLGDSITLGHSGGYPGMLATNLGGDYTVTNAGVAGNTPADIMARFSLLAPNAYGYVVVLGGINGIGLGETVQFHSLRRSYDIARHNGSLVIALHCTPCKGYAGFGASEVTKTKALNAMIAATIGIVAVDLYTAMGGGADGTDPDTLLAAYNSGDNGHPSDGAGMAVIEALVRAAVLANL